MARAADQFRSSDITVWGIVALLCWGVAVLSANLSALVPAGIFAGLHASRLEGATVNQLRSQVVQLEAESQRMRRENSLLLQRFDLAEQARGEVTRRVGALEVSLPQVLERLPETATIDRSATASIVEGQSMSFEAEGGSVSVVQKPLIAIQAGRVAPPMAETTNVEQALVGDAFGVALGFPITTADAEVQWQSLTAKVGTLLLGLWPVLADSEGSDGKIVVAGPVATRSQAAELCDRMDRVGIPCEPVPFEGEPLPLLN